MLLSKIWDFIREVEKEMFRDMGNKIDVFSKYGEWENEHKMSNGVIVYLAMLLGFSVGGWISVYK